MPSPVNQAVALYLQAMLPKWLAIDVDVKRGGRPRPGMISMRDAPAKILERTGRSVPYPSVQSVIKHAKGAGIDFEEAMAKLQFDGDVTKLRRAAEDWLSKRSPTLEPDESRYGRVLQLASRMTPPASVADVMRVVDGLAALDGSISDEEIVARLRGMSVVSGTVVSEGDTRALDELSGGRASLPLTTRRGRK